jgi:hypothetical protein
MPPTQLPSGKQTTTSVRRWSARKLAAGRVDAVLGQERPVCRNALDDVAEQRRRGVRTVARFAVARAADGRGFVEGAKPVEHPT